MTWFKSPSISLRIDREIVALADSEHSYEQSPGGEWLLTSEACDHSGEIVKFALPVEQLKRHYDRGLGTQIAQLYKLVLPGLILSEHIFQGLNRDLYSDGDVNAAPKKLIYTRKPSVDVRYDRSAEHHGREPILNVAVPANRVFIVIVTPNGKHGEQYPGIDGWIERWNWVLEDQGLPGAPEDWIDRYDTKLWSRP